MKARRLLNGLGSSFGPDALKVICKAFEAAWGEVQPSVSSRAIALEAARLGLAIIVLSIATEDTSDPDQLKNEALRIFRLKQPYPAPTVDDAQHLCLT